ncbi:hypothetical protein AO366_1425 [Moraxella catarrhalis]|uniref:hypothetical protein n=1 Tax=Moraxella catarrhalis TaxID=480 RepID=UPI0007E4CAFC|nr:hypothetical protein [Moraxella catarrhalis]OAV00834.1 hypothetical protein AO381_1782 [Moraxella catarrhalis]OAV03822.1 hypothetical protein AO380_1673 [Moraxella catarrhalis]OAV05079.1 hypothetical protein AO379_1812 [Moraxella catarrhalis]OAV08823.1 hypothetical protein AO377_1483 [Moraxella catarrhalis]OAV32448.1 hypothetical protein AO367_0042 [Moraxella catarrhalis]
MKKPIWQALVLSAMIILSACAQKTEEATAEPVEEKEVPMSAEPAEPIIVVPSDSSSSIEQVVPEAFAEGDSTQIAEVVEIDETAKTATQDAEVQEGQ